MCLLHPEGDAIGNFPQLFSIHTSDQIRNTDCIFVLFIQPTLTVATATLSSSFMSRQSHRFTSKKNVFTCLWRITDEFLSVCPSVRYRNDRRHLSFLSNSLLRYFSLNQRSGMLTIRQHVPAGSYWLRVGVSDGVWPDVISGVRVHVRDLEEKAIASSASLRLTGKV